MPQLQFHFLRVAQCKLFVHRTVFSQHAMSTLLTYLPMSAGWPPVIVPSRHALLVIYSSLCGHFTSASEDVRLNSKEIAHFNGLANKLSSVLFCWTWHRCLMISRWIEVEIIITNCTCCNGANLQLNFELYHVKYYSLLQNSFVLMVHTVFFGPHWLPFRQDGTVKTIP